MRLAQTLCEDGFDAWTPIETRTVRVPRINLKRELRLPIMPSYVFAKAANLIDLILLSDMPVKPRRGNGLQQPAHHDFRVMRCGSGIPTVTDADLAELRKIEAKRTPRKKAAKAFPHGADVRVEGGSFGGMAGIVQSGDRTHTLVCFNDRYLVKIPTCILAENMLRMDRPDLGLAA